MKENVSAWVFFSEHSV